jgi:hypothetical protein
MTDPDPLVAGKAIRVGPGQAGQPIGSIWKFWVEGNELYAIGRDMGHAKISVHASGRIHMRGEKRDMQLLAPAVPLAGSRWNHVLEVRFLIAPDRVRLPPKKLKKKDKAFLVDVADGRALVLNLIISAADGDTNASLPGQFAGGRLLWRSSLIDGRAVALIGRVTPIDAENQAHIERFRGVDGPKVTLTDVTKSLPEMEICQVSWSQEGGNFALIVPMGREVVRTVGGPTRHGADGAPARRPEVSVICPDASCEIVAPNRAVIGNVSICGTVARATLSKNEHVRVQLGTIRLAIHAEHLITGQTFETPSFTMECVPTVDGRKPRNWDYSVHCKYDGEALIATIRPNSVGLLANESSSLPPEEGIILVAPVDGLTLVASPAKTEVETALTATLLLYDLVQK